MKACHLFLLYLTTTVQAVSFIEIREAAENGDPDSQSTLGTMYYEGDGIDRDYLEAIKWIRTAALQGHIQAQVKLAFMYGNGLGVLEDDAKAANWYNIAAEQGNALAQYNLGVAYALGIGLPIDRTLSYAWYSIAAVNGYAYAGGCELALMCDFIYASTNARFALTEVSIGIMPGAGGTQNLPRAIGERRAKELILAAQPWDAAQALEWGLVNHVCEPGVLLETTFQTAQRICQNAPIAVRQAKKSIHHGLQVDNMTGLIYEVQCYERMISTEDRREGIAAFNEKRKAEFKGR